MTTIDVEEAVLDKPEATSEHYSSRDAAGNLGCAGHAAAEAARTAGTLLDLALYPVKVVLHRIPVRRHFDVCGVVLVHYGGAVDGGLCT